VAKGRLSIPRHGKLTIIRENYYRRKCVKIFLEGCIEDDTLHVQLYYKSKKLYFYS